MILLILSVSAPVVSAVSKDLSNTGKTVVTIGDWVYEAVEGGKYWELDEYRGESENVVVPRIINDMMVTSIGSHCFVNNTTVTSVSTSSPLWTVGDYAFLNCSSLETFECNFALKEIKVGAFSGTSALKSINLESSVISEVKPHSFMNSGIEEVALPDTCSKIDNYAFGQCVSLKKITIPSSVTEIHEDAFKGSDNVVIYCYTDSAAHQYAVSKNIPFVLLDAPAKEYFVGRSLSLDGDIGVNFYLDLTADEAKSATVNFSWNVNNEVKTSSFDLSNAKKLTAGYKATCRIAPAEMTGSILAELLINDEKVSESRYSAKQYADVILSDSYQAAYQGTGARSYENLRNLILNMLSFGSRAQTAFEVNLDTLADKDSGYIPEPVTADDIPVAVADMTEGLDNYGLSYVGSTLVCLTETTIRHYYRVTDQSKFDTVKNSIFIEGKPASAVEKNGSIYFEINNIPAADLDRYYTLKIGSNEYKYSAFNYIKTALPSDKVEDDVKNLIQVLYRYNQAANAFFA